MEYDDTYTGPRWTYGLTYRPLAQSNVPIGWVLWSDRSHREYSYGTVDYPRELTTEELEAYQMEFLSQKEGV